MSADKATERDEYSGQDSGRRVAVWTYVLLLVATLSFAAATAYGVVKLRQESREVSSLSRSTVWLVISLEREHNLFSGMIWRYRSGDSRLSVDDMITQFDIFWSRVDLMGEGSNAKPLQLIEGYDDVVTPARKLLLKHEQAFFDAVENGKPLPDEFVAEIEALEAPIHQFVLDVFINRQWADELLEAQSKDTRFAIFATLSGTLISTVLLFAAVLIQLKGRQKNLARTLQALRQSKRDSEALKEEVIYRERLEQDRETLLLDLESRNEELERYAYTISHDLKSPLYTIQGFTGFLKRDLERGRTEKMRHDLDKVLEAVKTMSSLLDDILNLSKINLVQESAQLLSLDEIIDGAKKLVELELREKAVQVEIAPSLPQVYATPQRLTEVFQNLISNAAKFMGEQQNPKIEIGARLDGDWVHCHVCDNGIGIDPEYKDRVFNLFERLDGNTPGTGVGLAIVKRIIERGGGNIKVESEGPGHGSCFEFSLPASAPASSSAA